MRVKVNSRHPGFCSSDSQRLLKLMGFICCTCVSEIHAQDGDVQDSMAGTKGHLKVWVAGWTVESRWHPLISAWPRGVATKLFDVRFVQVLFLRWFCSCG